MRPHFPPLNDKAILALTKNGERELREPGTSLGPPQLEALVLIDGYSTVAQVAKRARSMTPDALREILGDLIDRNFVSATMAHDAIDPGDFFNLETPVPPLPEAGEKMKAAADADVEFLRRNGYCVNVARRPAKERKLAEGQRLTVFIIDDDPDICDLLQKYFKLEGFDTRIAVNREEVVAAFRHPPLPDLVLLDVFLPDVNGFDILAKMRQHPVLKELPVIMLTGAANREAVLKGLQGGADGYITKPFQIHPLVRAVKTVLGIKFDPSAADWDFSL